jgi:trimeric autotransporter adhesin
MLSESGEQLRAQTIPKPHTAASASASAAASAAASASASAASAASAEGLWETAKALLRRRRVRGTDIGQMKSRRARTGRAAEAKGGQARAKASSDEGVAKLGHPRRRGHATWASGAATAAAAAAATSATSAAAASATSAAALAAGKAPAAAVGGSPRRVRSPKLLCGEVGGASW